MRAALTVVESSGEAAQSLTVVRKQLMMECLARIDKVSAADPTSSTPSRRRLASYLRKQLEEANPETVAKVMTMPLPPPPPPPSAMVTGGGKSKDAAETATEAACKSRPAAGASSTAVSSGVSSGVSTSSKSSKSSKKSTKKASVGNPLPLEGAAEERAAAAVADAAEEAAALAAEEAAASMDEALECAWVCEWIARAEVTNGAPAVAAAAGVAFGPRLSSVNFGREVDALDATFC